MPGGGSSTGPSLTSPPSYADQNERDYEAFAGLNSGPVAALAERKCQCSLPIIWCARAQPT